jgi:hypothetical protein
MKVSHNRKPIFSWIRFENKKAAERALIVMFIGIILAYILAPYLNRLIPNEKKVIMVEKPLPKS